MHSWWSQVECNPVAGEKCYLDQPARTLTLMTSMHSPESLYGWWSMTSYIIWPSCIHMIIMQCNWGTTCNHLVSSPDPILEEGELGSGELGTSTWAYVEEFPCTNQISTLAQSLDYSLPQECCSYAFMLTNRIQASYGPISTCHSAITED